MSERITDIEKVSADEWRRATGGRHGDRLRRIAQRGLRLTGDQFAYLIEREPFCPDCGHEWESQSHARACGRAT